MLACGLDRRFMFVLLGFTAGGLTCLLSIISGVICLFCSQINLGLWLIGVPFGIIGVALAWVAIASHSAG